ncbi:flagellar basal-body MS-ring/collar protein FliF [Cellulomonas fimi]|uniref:Flagellar M-ring protein n=1 Tax=Cellulomonas fimi (strain ATCC 484 / DSM 20113 / JCM 1341 / CCUG 24087 / LMG 16345 / NBRC 15513 / NCIMB 8980 / NCTC 7547 / NRS-133) TaxID=590998 RepID=F4GYU2_CELFA|nr:flagellar basal-body MS-ring/collar protein FliF [Cellulomonas fimi]AEE44811.1 flagellar M-ring protein FliF [Cellulomonas fimi ATCC 484]NNH08373.1 flagellar M-ring protein FliF [Cellulomonas fimi]VEH27358.1 Flagellar M-ring protein [Cellulomonas fimi]
MPAQVQAAVDRLTGAVRQFSIAQRTLGLIGVAVLLLGAFALSTYLSRPTMSPLFSGLSGADASAVVDELTAAGVQYQLADGGSTVLVPDAQLYDQRIRLAAAGLPTNADGGGYSLLDEMPMTSSEFQQQTTYQRALEGELARTVGAIDGVESASVKLALPEESVFVSEKADPTASVFIRTRPGTSLSLDQVQAIVHLVSAGIDGMTPTDVAVVDATGEVLSAVGTGTTGGVAGQQASDYEARVAASVQALLDPLVGPGRSAVTVTAEIDQSQTDRTVEEFTATPDTPPLASSTTTETYTGGAASGAAGVLGPDNIQVPNGDGTTGEGSYESTTEDVTNAVNKSTERTTQGPGAIQRQSVAVVLDEKAAAPIDLAQLRETIAAAAGIDPERGDTIAVQAVPFDTTQAEEAGAALAAAEEAEKAAQQTSLIRQAAIGGVVLALLLAIAIAMTRRSRKARRTAIDLGELQPVLTDEQRALEGLPEDALPELPPGPLPGEPDPVARKRAEITALADDQPQEVADLLRGWLGTATPAGRR